MPAVKALALRPSMDEIIMKIKAELGERAEWLRNVSLYCCQKYSGAKLKDIGERFRDKRRGSISGQPEVRIKSRN